MDERPDPGDQTEATWGPRLFYGAIIAALLFFWWLLIYDHGVTPLHGG